MTTQFTLLHRAATPDMLGCLPRLVTVDDPRPVREQLAERHRRGWVPVPGPWRIEPGGSAQFHTNPPLRPYAKATIRDETVYVYFYDWVCIMQPNGRFEMGKIDRYGQ